MHTRERFEAALHAVPVIGIVRAARGDVAPAVRALIEGGLRLVEVTLTTPDALRAIREASDAPTHESTDALVGAGSVRRAAEAEAAIAAGARFLVTPNLSPAVLEIAHAADVPVVCGAFSPTEIHEASDRGAALVKVFPASVLGPPYLREVRAPMPELRLVPTGGVDLGNLSTWFDAGATAIALGSALVGSDDIAGARWAEIRARATSIVSASIAARDAAK